MLPRIALSVLAASAAWAGEFAVFSSGFRLRVERHERAGLEGPLPVPAMKGVKVTTMGRSAEEEPTFFQLSYAAGEIASSIAASML